MLETEKPIVRPGDDRVCHDRDQKPLVRPGDDRVCQGHPKLINQYPTVRDSKVKTKIENEIASAKIKI